MKRLTSEQRLIKAVAPLLNRKIVYEQNGIRHEVGNEFQTHAPDILWKLYVMELNPAAKKILNDVHGIVCALYGGKVYLPKSGGR